MLPDERGLKSHKMRLIVAISGASGTIYAVELLRALKKFGNVETHLIISEVGEKILKAETGLSKGNIVSLVTRYYNVNDLEAPITSGSYAVDGMVIVPCSMKTLAGVANGYSDNLILRAADVALKERRPLVLVVRETPLNLIHLENMVKAARAGAIILPASPAFYHKPESVKDLVDYVVKKILAIFKFEYRPEISWGG